MFKVGTTVNRRYFTEAEVMKDTDGIASGLPISFPNQYFGKLRASADRGCVVSVFFSIRLRGSEQSRAQFEASECGLLSLLE